MSRQKAQTLLVDPDALEAGELVAPALIHEMRQPLLGLKVGLQLLARQLGTALTAQEDFALVGDQVARLEEILRGYQQFLDPHRQAVAELPLEPVVRRAVALLRFRHDRLGHRFTVECAPGLPYARASAHPLLHALTNVLVNAFDALEEGAPEARVAVRLARSLEGQRLEIRVSDEGSGIPAELRARIFETRFTTKAPGKGSGLGLAIARRMMAGVGGEVRLAEADDAARAPWARTEFVLSVPVAPPRVRTPAPTGGTAA